MMWNANTYDCSGNFVIESGEKLIKLIPDDKSQKILDIGCGNGKLTDMIAKKCGHILGIDNSMDMINIARAEYPNIEFELYDALDMSSINEWDIIFSNAVFHWIDDHDLLLKKISRALKSEGKLICEFGAAGNNSEFENGLKKALEKRGRSFEGKFNFTTEEEFGKLLMKNGFVTDCICTYNKKTPLLNGENGLREWIINFYGNILSKYNLSERQEILKEIEDDLKPQLWNGKDWMADYKRINVVAHTL